jgi:hypothetical protein
MDHEALPSIPVGDQAALRKVLARRALTRPPILDATRAIGLTDSDLARLIGCSAMVVSEWVTGKRPIPKEKLAALALFLLELEGTLAVISSDLTEGPHAKRAQVLGEAITKLVWMSIE